MVAEQIVAETATERDGRTDFDFLFGRWTGHNRRLRERLKGCTDWEEFEGILEVRPILNGLGNVDEVVFERESGPTRGVTLRLYNPVSRQWSIYWADSVSGVLQDPMIGEFRDGRGEFYSQEPFEGRAIFSRFIWSVFNESSCRWEQAFSADGGKHWETNWVCDFRRLA
jgi:hypothetical protein